MLRTADLVDLWFSFQGLVFQRPGVRRVLVRADAGREGWIVVTFTPLDFFDALGAKLFGIIPLSLLVKEAGLDKELKAPRFFTETVNAVTGFLSDLRRVERVLIGVATRFPAVADKAERVRQTALALVDAVEAFVAGSGDIARVEAAFGAFNAALDELGAGLPGTVDQAVLTLLRRIREAAATWDSLKQAIAAFKQGTRLPEAVNARMEWVPDIQRWPDTYHPVFDPHDGYDDKGVFHPDRVGRFSLVVDLRGAVRPDLRPGADITCTKSSTCSWCRISRRWA